MIESQLVIREIVVSKLDPLLKVRMAEVPLFLGKYAQSHTVDDSLEMNSLYHNKCQKNLLTKLTSPLSSAQKRWK